MLKPLFANLIVVLIGLSMTGCGIYDKYGYDRVVSSRLDETLATPVELTPNAPSISQRFLPREVSSKSELKVFDILVPSHSPVLAAASGEVSRAQTSILHGLAGGFPHLHFEVHRLGEGAEVAAVRFLDPQLLRVDGKGKVTCYDNHRERPAEPAVLIYPVPCPGVEWQ